MTRRLSALIGALEAVLVAVVGLALPLVPFTVVWGAVLGFGSDFAAVWRAAVDTWLIGHGVDVRFTLDAATAAALGVPGAGDPVVVSFALLGIGLATLLLARRAGRRIAQAPHPLLGAATALVAFEAITVLATVLSLHEAARPSIVQAATLPALVFAVGGAIGLVPALPREALAPLRDRIPEDARLAVTEALRLGLACVAGLVAVAAVAVAVLLAVHYDEVIALYESLHTEALGGVVLTLGELALLPDLVVWAASWLVGPGFALGAGSQVSPVGTAVGPVPAIPVLGAVPTGDLPFALAGLVAPVGVAFLVAVVVRSRVERLLGRLDAPLLVGLAAGGGLAGGALVAVLCAAASGSAGPGRLVEVGPTWWLVGLVAAAEFAVALALGLLAAGRRPRAAQ